MKNTPCQMCNKAPATAHFKQVCNGEVREVFVCEECARKQGLNVSSPISVTDFLFGIGVQSQGSEKPEADRACPVCHMRISDFRKTSRLGCGNCYEAFEAELAPMLATMQKGLRHTGKVPVSALARMQAEELRGQLQSAVKDQNFEEAARLRDLIRVLDDAVEAAVACAGADGDGD